MFLHSAASRSGTRTARGYTLTEIAIVMGIAGLILGAIWALASRVSMSNRMTVAMQQLEAIVNNIQAIYAEQGSVEDPGGNTLTQALDQLKAFPLDMRQNQASALGVIFHPWSMQTGGGFTGSGSVVVDGDDCTGAAGLPRGIVHHSGAASASPGSSTTHPCFGITYYDVPSDACAKLLMEVSQAGLGLQTIVVNGTDVASLSGGTLPVQEGTVSASCNNTGVFGTNDITWQFATKSGVS